jgi:hypothetical protein
MSRIAEGLAKKGSQKWQQRVLSEYPEMQDDGLGFRDLELELPTACIHLPAQPGIPKEFP